MLILGPFIAATSHETPGFDDFVGTGFALELFINGRAYVFPIFQDTSHWRRERPDFIDYYLLSRDEDWPFEFDCRNFQSRNFVDLNLVRISPFLRALFTDHHPEADIVDFLKDFRALLHVGTDCDHGNPYRPACEVNLRKQLADAGFSVIGIVHHGRTLGVELAWSFQGDHPTWQNIHAGRMTFYVAEGRITKAAWKPHHWPESIEDLFWQKLRKVAPADPAACFASESDLANLLLHIEWEPTLTLSASELQEQRLQCIADFPNLWQRPMDLARVLLERKLYASSTTLWHIARTVDKTIARLQSELAHSQEATQPEA